MRAYIIYICHHSHSRLIEFDVQTWTLNSEVCTLCLVQGPVMASVQKSQYHDLIGPVSRDKRVCLL